MVAPITAAASGRLSTITGTPSFLSSAGCSSRARMSEPPPGARGTTSLTGSDGYFGCAPALPATRSPAVAARSPRLLIMSAPSCSSGPPASSRLMNHEPAGSRRSGKLKHLPAPPFRRTFPRKGESTGVDAEIDQYLGDLDGRARSFQHRHVPADFEQPLLQQRLQPEGSRAAEDDRVGAVLLDGGDRFLHRRLQHVRRAALDGTITLDVDRPVVGMVGRGQREVDVAD